MKKISVLILCLSVFLCACTGGKNMPANSSAKTSAPDGGNETSMVMDLNNSLVLGSGELDDGTGSIQVVLKCGEYSYDNLSKRASYKGNFYIQYYVDDELVSETKFVGINGAAEFSGEFKIISKDYNNDGSSDFLIGQSAGSNGTKYRMFSINKDKEIYQISMGSADFIYAASTLASYELTKEDENVWSYQQYDQNSGNCIVKLKWNGEKFEELERVQENDKWSEQLMSSIGEVVKISEKKSDNVIKAEIDLNRNGKIETVMLEYLGNEVKASVDNKEITLLDNEDFKGVEPEIYAFAINKKTIGFAFVNDENSWNTASKIYVYDKDDNICFAGEIYADIYLSNEKTFTENKITITCEKDGITYNNQYIFKEDKFFEEDKLYQKTMKFRANIVSITEDEIILDPYEWLSSSTKKGRNKIKEVDLDWEYGEYNKVKEKIAYKYSDSCQFYDNRKVDEKSKRYGKIITKNEFVNHLHGREYSDEFKGQVTVTVQDDLIISIGEVLVP